MKPFAIDRANGICAALFIAFGACFALQSLGLEIGTAFRMGPGYFPLILAIVLILLGAVILVQAVRFEAKRSATSRGAACCSSCLLRSSSA